MGGGPFGRRNGLRTAFAGWGYKVKQESLVSAPPPRVRYPRARRRCGRAFAVLPAAVLRNAVRWSRTGSPPYDSINRAAGSQGRTAARSDASEARVSEDIASADPLAVTKNHFRGAEMVPGGGVEPPTRRFSVVCSTTELPRHIRGRGKSGRPLGRARLWRRAGRFARGSLGLQRKRVGARAVPRPSCGRPKQNRADARRRRQRRNSNDVENV